MRDRIFNFDHLRQVFAPRKPRHPLVKLALGLIGLAILAGLVFISVFVGAAMILGGIAMKLLSQRGKRPATVRHQVVDGEYRVVRKPALPL
ncbi:membrane protein [Xanthomonas sp. GPE 39]|uniref:membrane protein n=1 Tax=Xanthomonas sp. GPE 39 TaxID=1583099 RepID=UPI0005F2AEB0|nr:membrane protein [Xanthomonas sp. GPE 39]